MKRLPGIHEIGSSSPVWTPKEPFPSCRPATIRWAVSRPIIPGVLSCRRGDMNAVVPGFYAAGRMRLRLGAWRQPPGYQLPARPPGFGKSAGDSAVEDLKAGPLTAICRRMPPTSRWRVLQSDNRKGGANVPNPSGHAARHAGSRWRVPFGDMLKQGVKRSWKSKRLLANSRSRTSRWPGTRPVPKRSKWKT